MVSWVKIGVDAAVLPDGNIGVGSIIIDSYGYFIEARCKMIKVHGNREKQNQLD